VSNVVSGDRHTCAVVDDRVMCWGKNGSGQTGALESPYEATPRLVAALDQWKVAGLAAGGDTTCVIREGGAVHCFGSNRYGQLGQAPDETPWPAGFPVRVPGGATSIAVGLTHVCAATGEGRVHCWGANGAHQFGR
jgi:alpha-tubulin suppressor-like RCC1 family protein